MNTKFSEAMKCAKDAQKATLFVIHHRRIMSKDELRPYNAVSSHFLHKFWKALRNVGSCTDAERDALNDVNDLNLVLTNFLLSIDSESFFKHESV